AHECGLCDFVGLAQIPKFAGTRAANRWVVTTEQLAESVVISGLGGQNQHGVTLDVVWCNSHD
ncbi:MAG: hypothetical protein Q8K63_08560, partial [Acidimicrobiales bacterium]|nr:hypothetical protein [Acidimicrobiales bacterium]